MSQEWYEIQLKGQLSASWSDWFDGMEVRALEGGEMLLRGPLADQAALHGVLARAYALNLTLLGLRRIEPEPATCRQQVIPSLRRSEERGL
jgi:hypothetical protein